MSGRRRVDQDVSLSSTPSPSTKKGSRWRFKWRRSTPIKDNSSYFTYPETSPAPGTSPASPTSASVTSERTSASVTSERTSPSATSERTSERVQTERSLHHAQAPASPTSLDVTSESTSKSQSLSSAQAKRPQLYIPLPASLTSTHVTSEGMSNGGSSSAQTERSPQVPASPTSPGMTSERTSNSQISFKRVKRSRPHSQVPASPTSPGVTSALTPSADDGLEPDWNIRKLVHSLSLKDDPRMFGSGTIAARRIQREELDAAMAQTLFRRELALDPVGYMRLHTVVEKASPADTGRPAGEDLREEGLPEEGLPEEDLPEQLILPPEEARILHASLSRDPPSRAAADPGATPPERTGPQGLSAAEISRLLTTFRQQGTVRRADSAKRHSRIRGRQVLPKGAQTTGIMSQEEAPECAICLVDFQVGQKIGLLPCCHRFHAECAVDWLQRSATCPECREPLRHHLH